MAFVTSIGKDIQEYYRQMLAGSAGSSISGPTEEFRQPEDFNPTNSRTPSLAPGREDLMSPVESSEWEYIEVVISRPAGQNQSFGFSIAGGYDAPQENGDPSIYVTRLAPGGIAELDNRLRPFDQIISVNGTDLTCVSNQEAVKILRESGDTLAMIIRRFSGAEVVSSEGDPYSPMSAENVQDDERTLDDDLYYEANLVKPSASVGLGFTIAGGQVAEGGPEGIFVTKITPGGLAEKDGQIQPGDRLIQVNGQKLDGATHEDAVHLLRTAGTYVHLVLSRHRDSESRSYPSQVNAQ
uniref:PDZ domain-containing protein n=1 Tax=Mesocestoides corti TaxID=53468 RepID=A0A5K3F3U2_MESCO